MHAIVYLTTSHNHNTCTGQLFPLNPILSRSVVSSLVEVNPGDHVTLKSQHYLISSVHLDDGFFTAYTTNFRGVVVKSDMKLTIKNNWTRIDYDHHSNSFHPEEAVGRAAVELEKKSKWDCSDHFVSKMKCGRRHVISERCLFEAEVEPLGCTLVTPHMAMDMGDHLILRVSFGVYRSFLVYSIVDEHTIVSIPSMHGRKFMGELNLLEFNNVYRVNYKQSLPIEEIFSRSSSPEGEQLLLDCLDRDTTRFVTWAKVGREISMNAEKIVQRQQIAEIRPSVYEKVVSMHSIEVGDHLFIPNTAYRWHVLVSGKIQDNVDSMVWFRLTYLLRGMVKETAEVLDPQKDDIFKVIYPEEFPPSLAVKRARSLVGTVNLSPTARMWFVRWAKTGSDEGLEIDFMKKQSLPVYKSRIACFTQLDPGDYLVVDRGRFSPRLHYLVTRVESPRECVGVGAWKGWVAETKVCLQDSVCHKIVYEEGACLSAAESIQRARDVVQSPFSMKYMRRKLVNFLKTTDASEVDVANLQDNRFLLRREKVNFVSTADIKPGDHLEIAVKASQRVTYRNLIVADIVSERKMRVLCIGPERGVVERDYDLVLGEDEEVYRVKYVDQVSVCEGLDMLRRHSGTRHTHRVSAAYCVSVVRNILEDLFEIWIRMMFN